MLSFIIKISVLMLGLEQEHLLYLSLQPHQTHSNYHCEHLSLGLQGFSYDVGGVHYF